MEPRIVALIAALVLPAFAIAQPVPDHLKCYKVKDSRAKATYTADLGGLVSEPGCLIKIPAPCSAWRRRNEHQPGAAGWYGR